MPGAPNRPPETKPEAAPATPVAPEAPELRLMRRLAPSRVALSLDVWHGAPSAELVTPLEKAELAFAASDWREADSQLDALSIRFHEPRWPTLPDPFRELRVAIPAPTPPQWNPDHGLPTEEKEARRVHRTAEMQLKLARATVEWARTKGIDLADVVPPVEPAGAAFEAGGAVATLYEALDPLWRAVHGRVPMPKPPAAPTARPGPKAVEPAVEEA
ncbi:MAG: hypothetical protein ACREB9_03135 [Thermoplasmata archaeon]